MVSIMAARWPRWGSWPLAVWLLLPLFGCGATLQAEDQATVAAVQGARKLYDAKQYEQARERATALLAKSPDSAAAHYVRGLAAIKLSDYAAARADLQKARQLDPLLVFAKSKDEFEAAWRVARENTMDALGGTVTTPPPPGEAAAPKPASAPKPKKTVSKDPLARVLAAEGPVLHDASGQKVLGPAQLKSMQKAVSNLAARKLTLKMLVLKPGAAVEAEAKRLFTAAALDDDVLLVVGVPGGKVAAYTPLKTPEALRSEVAKVVTGAAGVSLPRRMMLVATAVGGALQAPPELPEQPAPPPPPPPAAPVPTATPVAPPATAPWLWAAAGAGAALAALLLWLGVSRLLARRRLASGFGLASPRLAAVADALTDTLRELLQKPDRRAAAAHAMAELAFAEASSMMGEAARDDLGDIARVERAVRLLDESTSRLDEAKAALVGATTREGGTTYLCYFTGRPLADRYDGDLVLLRQGGEERLVMVARTVGEQLRRGERPAVRVVEQGGQLRHWAQVPEYDPVYDLYHTERFGRRFVPPDQLPQLFFEDQGRLFVTLSERPDYTLDLDRS